MQSYLTLSPAPREICALLEAYREKIPRKRKSNVHQLRSVGGAAEGGDDTVDSGGPEEARGGKENSAVDDGTAAFKQQFPVALKEPPPGYPRAEREPETEPERAPEREAERETEAPRGGLFGGAQKKSSGGGLFEVRSRRFLCSRTVHCFMASAFVSLSASLPPPPHTHHTPAATAHCIASLISWLQHFNSHSDVYGAQDSEGDSQGLFGSRLKIDAGAGSLFD